MNKNILDFYLSFSQYTFPGLYKDHLKSLPDNISEIASLVRSQLVHRTTLDAGNTGTNADMRYGDMTKMPWYRQAEDDNFVTSIAIIAELFRRDPRGIVKDRKVEDRLVLTCRYVAILMASILKSKGIPARVRSGFAPYFTDDGKSWDHWINEYWNEKEKRWTIIDVDGSLNIDTFDPYDMPSESFDFSADAWLKVRKGELEEKHFWNAKPQGGLEIISWELFYDLHCLMNNEIIYLHNPLINYPWKNVKEEQLKDFDNIAELMLQPDENYEKLKEIFNNNRDIRLLKGALL